MILRRNGLRVSGCVAVLAAAAFLGGFASGVWAQTGAAADRAALEALYDATDGPNWTNSANWKTDAPLDTWHGVTTDAAGRVALLELRENGLAGPIPAALGSLANLERLALNFNDLSGPIPPALGGLTNLERLDLGYNDLSGPIPPALGGLTNLERLDLGYNDLSGPIPAALGSLANLESLSLDFNDLSGPIPAALGSLANLRVLTLYDIGVMGPIPAALGSLANLEYLYLAFNHLTGPVPAWLGDLARLRVLSFEANPMTGPLPRELTRLSALDELYINRTELCVPNDTAFKAWLETIETFNGGATCNRSPVSVGAFPAQTLTAAGPALGVSAAPYFSDPDEDPLIWSAASGDPRTVSAFVSGDIVWLVPGAAGAATVTVTARDPDGLSATQDMAVTTGPGDGPQSDREVLEVFYDSTGGANWANSANWKTAAPLSAWHGVTTDAAGRVTRLDLFENELNGPVPPALGNLANLEYLHLGSNDLSGPIPAALGSLTNLERLHLWGNGFSGPIPDALGSLTNLKGLNLNLNYLSGPIPAALGSLANLQRLSLWGNYLSGPIPAWLGSLTNLEQLDLAKNVFSGPIPSALGNLANLEYLHLGWNDLSGPIPAALGSLTNLERLHLRNIALSGSIPASLGSLTNLRVMNLRHTWGVSGPLPAGLRSAASLAEMDIWLTRACAPAAWSDWLKTIDFSGRLCGDGAVTVDVAVVHTPAAREAAGGAPEIDAVVDLMVAETNQAYETSGVRHRIALAGRAEVQYVETGQSWRDLYRLAHPSDGHMDEAHALRDRVGADLVHLIVDAERAEVGGIANLGGPFGLTIHTGSGRTFAHELGHNMALRHDRYQVHHHERGGTGPHPAYGYVNQPGLLPVGRSRRWRTIMAYFTQCLDAYTDCVDLFRFSNPRQRHGDDPLGVPYGTGGSGATGPADAAAVLDVMMPVVARWRDRPARANRPPTAAAALPDRTLSLPGTLTMDVSRAFADPDGDPLTWAVSSSAPGVVTVTAAGPRVTLTAVSIGSATIGVTATDPGGLSASQSFTATVADRPPFTDNPILPGATPIRAVHFTELRARIDGLRQAAGLTPFGWTDPVLRAGATPVRLVHLLELRRALAAAYTASGRTPPRWTDAAPAPGTTPIRAAHLNELRAAVVALE